MTLLIGSQIKSPLSSLLSAKGAFFREWVSSVKEALSSHPSKVVKEKGVNKLLFYLL